MKAFLSFIAAFILIFSSSQSPAKAIVLFDDVLASDPYAFEIAFLYEEGIITGYPDGTFRPDKPITRADAVTMIGRASNWDDTPRATGFKDVPASHPNSGYIASAVDEGIVDVNHKGKFRPDAKTSRAQAAVLLDRAFYFPEAPDNDFRDMRKRHYAFDAISRLDHQGVFDSYRNNKFRPGKPVKRAEFAAFLARTIEPVFIAEKQELLMTANEILADLQAKNFGEVAAYVSRKEGLKFCPYSGGCISNGGMTLTKSQVRYFMQDTNGYLWGYRDGSGFEINLTPAEYYDEFLLDATYTAKERYGRTIQPTTQEFIRQLYPKATIVDFYFPGTAQYDQMDWQSLNMVFEKNRHGDWILVAIINDRWTI